MQAQRCPVCMGKGTVPAGFYDSTGTGCSISTNPNQCRACGGRGIVMVPETQPFVPYAPPVPVPWEPGTLKPPSREWYRITS